MGGKYSNRVHKTLKTLGHRHLTINDNLLEKLDSLDWVEAVMAFEEEFEKEIPDEVVMDIWENSSTLTYVELARKIYEYIERGNAPAHQFAPIERIELSFQVEPPPEHSPKPTKEKQTNLLDILSNLSNLQNAIDRADNKQAKRIQDRDRAVAKINNMLPKGWSLVNNNPTFDSNEIEEGSTWECTSNIKPCFSDCTVGGHYVMHCDHNVDRYYFNDDRGDTIIRGKNPIIDSFKRVK